MMSDKKWTPGEWFADDGAVRTGDKALVSLVYGNGEGSFNANAHLIAAAPDLYEALEMAQLWLDIDGRYDMQRINAALAKARGEQK